MKTVIMAGGRGTRISSMVPDIPKPMIPIGGKPVLQHEIECLIEQGFQDIVITVSYLGSVIMDYFGDGRRFGASIQYYYEKTPLGNAGALYKLRDTFDSDFLLINADVVFDVDLNRFVSFHQEKGGLVTLFTHPNSHPFDSGVLIADKNGAVLTWLAREEERPKWYHNCVNAGLHVMNPAVLDKAVGMEPDIIGTEINGTNVKVDLDRQILKPLCGTRKMFCYTSSEYVKDMGTPDRYRTVCKDFANGLIKKKNLKRKQKAIFLDRDGTINRHAGFLRSIDDFELLPGVSEAVKKINESGYLAIVVTNQPVVARGEVTVEELQDIHNKMETLLAEEGAYLDGIYYCPHHPHRGYDGEVPELKIDCDCRKPKPGMLLRAAAEYNIDLGLSWMIGDSENDIKTGLAVGCKTALIGSDDLKQDIIADSLLSAVDKILTVS